MTDIKETFHRISTKRKMYFSDMLEKYELNLMEVEILAFLSEQPDNNTFTEIMRAKDYAKSHISNAITRLVNFGYVEKRQLERNKKVYKLSLLRSSENIIEDYNICVEKFRKDAFVGIKEREIKIFEQVIDKMDQNLD
ncbi:MAG: winged helix DNA-binding protein [Clostridia bacterium]